MPTPTRKPHLRGWLHAGMIPATLVAGVVLLVLAPAGATKVALAVYLVSAMLLFTISAVYHRFTWGPRVEGVLKRLDHANIFLIIAGSYTPFAVLLLEPGPARTLLWLVWAGALAGVAFRVFWVGAPRWLYVPVYLALGWTAVFFLPDFLRTGGIAVLVLIIAGGLLYSAGGVV
jgi:hemolysin III